MKVLVTGAAGQVGSALMASVPSGVSAKGLKRADVDLADLDAVRETIANEAPDWVVNCAAYTAVDKAESEPDLARRVNADAVGVMTQALNDCSGRLLQISTDCVFDGSAQRPYRPDDERNPISVYGETKAQGEDASGEDAAILRVSWVYASGHENFVTKMLSLLRERDQLRVVDDQIGSPSYAPDIARTIWGLIEKGAKGVFHHCDHGQTSRHGWACAVAEDAVEVGLLERAPMLEPIPSSDFPTPARRPLNSVLDASTTRDLLEDKPVPWRTNLRRMLTEEAQRG